MSATARKLAPPAFSPAARDTGPLSAVRSLKLEKFTLPPQDNVQAIAPEELMTAYDSGFEAGKNAAFSAQIEEVVKELSVINQHHRQSATKQDHSSLAIANAVAGLVSAAVTAISSHEKNDKLTCLLVDYITKLIPKPLRKLEIHCPAATHETVKAACLQSGIDDHKIIASDKFAIINQAEIISFDMEALTADLLSLIDGYFKEASR